MAFSDRIGITQPKSILQVDSIDDDLRNGLWQACTEHAIKVTDRHYTDDYIFQGLMNYIYVDFFKSTADSVPYGHEAGIQSIRKWFFAAEWWGVYNFVEFLFTINASAKFIDRATYFLEREKSGYRILNDQFVPIVDPIELEAVSDALSADSTFIGMQQHIRSAVALFAHKPAPDYRNAIKEAISAVESAAKVLTGDAKATLGDALKALHAKHPIHAALREAMSKLYGYTSDKGGIRHALLEESNIDEAEAKFMIVACSAFVNFCIQRSQ